MKDKLDIIIDLIKSGKVTNEEAKVLLNDHSRVEYVPYIHPYYSGTTADPICNPPFTITCSN